MSIQEEIIAMNQLFVNVMRGSVQKDWMIVGGELEFYGEKQIELTIHMIFAPYNHPHSENYNTKLYTKIAENYIKEIEAADDEELKKLAEHLNTVVQDNVDMSVLTHLAEGYLRGAYDYQYTLWVNKPESNLAEMSDNINVNIVPEYCLSEYFIYEDLALIRAGLDGKISNSIYYGDDTQEKYNYLSDFDEDDDIWSLLDEGKDD